MIGKRLSCRSLCLVVAVLTAVLAMTVPVSSVDAAGSGATNDVVGDLAVFRQDYTVMSGVPGNMCLAMDSMAGTTQGLSLSYDGTGHRVSLAGTSGASGKLFVGGLAPSLLTTITLDMGMSRTDQRAVLNVYAGGAWLAVRLVDGTSSDGLEMTSKYYTYTNPTLHLATSVTEDMGFTDSGRFKIAIVSNTADKTNMIYLNGVKKLTTPYTRFRAVNMTTAYDPFVNPFVYFDFASINSGQTARLHLYSIEQTVPEYSYVTPISDPRLISFGVDGPHPWNTVNDGLALLDGATIWADVTALDDYSAADMAALKALIADGFELGIHFSSRLSDLSMASAISLMDSETARITATFGHAPQSWCSLQGADNISHAEYAFTHLGMVSRNGANGSAAGLNSIGNLGDNCWTFWKAASAAGIVIPSFSHQLDVTPAIDWSISGTNFRTWVANYAGHGVRTAGFREYWQMAQNSYHTSISGIVSEPGVSLSFTVDNMGGRSRLLVNAPWASSVRDGSGAMVAFEAYGSGILIEAEDGDYTVAAEGAVPRADFSADRRIAVTGETVRFTDLSGGGTAPLSYEWDFGDGDGSDLQNPSHIYSLSGTFTVSLKVTDSAASADTETKTSYIKVNPPLSVTTGAATAVTASTATLNGSLASLGSASSVQVSFEWGPNTSYGSSTASVTKTGTGTFSAGLTGLAAGTTYHFRARAAGNGGATGLDATFTTSTTGVGVPALVSPADGALTGDRTPYLDWSKVTASSTVHYQLQVDNNADFSSPAVSKTWVSYSYYTVATSLPNGTYYWRVRAVDAPGNMSAWGGPWSFSVATVSPAVPTLVSPASGASTTDHTPYLDWSKVTASSTVHYQLQVDNNADFSSPSVNKTWVSYSYYTLTTTLSHGTYYWRVRAVDASGNSSAWSSGWSFRVA